MRYLRLLLRPMLVCLGALFVLLGMVIAFFILVNEARGGSSYREDLERTVYLEVEYLEFQEIPPAPMGNGFGAGTQYQLVVYRGSYKYGPSYIESTGFMPCESLDWLLMRKDLMIFRHFGSIWKIRYLRGCRTEDYVDHDIFYRAKKYWYNAFIEAGWGIIQ